MKVITQAKKLLSWPGKAGIDAERLIKLKWRLNPVLAKVPLDLSNLSFIDGKVVATTLAT